MMWRSALRVAFLAMAGTAPTAMGCAQTPAELLEDARQNFDRGELTSSERAFAEVLDLLSDGTPEERPAVAEVLAARAGLWAIDLRRGRYQEVLAGVQALAEGERAQAALQGLLAHASRRTGAYEQAAAIWQARLAIIPDDFEASCELGEVQWAAGQRQAARASWEAAVARPVPSTSLALAWRARCRWLLGGRDQVLAASEELVRALGLDERNWRARVTLGVLRLQVYGEALGYPSGERDLKQVLERHGDIEEALLWIYRLRSQNFQLDSGRTERYLQRLLEQNPRCMPGLVLRAQGVLDDRRYQDAAEMLDQALAIDARDREALAHRAAAAWLLHEADAYGAFRARALVGDPNCGLVERVVADHLVALYRFADAEPFYRQALAAEPDDEAALHGLAKVFVYTGRGTASKELLQRAKALEPGYVDPWRNNALAVQALLEEQYTTVEKDGFRVAMHRDDEEVIRDYLLPLCHEAYLVLGTKYQCQPRQPVTVELFHTWDDFSVRTIGFRGFTALGACFGPFLTMVSPGDTDLRQQEFMWEATLWHEYAHVLTLALSKHRVPRWLTEGFSVHEERARDPTWERGMDRELFDAFHNQDIPPVRLLNRLFRGERILFGYYQGGLIVDLIARDFGFDKALALLAAFGDDLETEAAFARALGLSSADFDRRLLEFVERDRLRGMRLVPRFDDNAVQRLLVKVAQQPDNLQARVDLAWAYVQRRNPVDAGPHLQLALQRDPDFGSALLVRAALFAARDKQQEAVDCWRRGFASGGDDFDSRIACGRMLQELGDVDGAEQMYQRAKACWSNCTEQENAPELLLAKLYRDTDRREMAWMEMKSYCQRTARAYTPRWTLAQFERQAGNRATEARYLEECRRIDPFRRELHDLLGSAYETLGKKADAALEYEVAAAVSPAQDRRWLREPDARPAADDPAELADRGRLWLQAAQLRWSLGEHERARSLLQRIEARAPASAAATTARELAQEWRAR